MTKKPEISVEREVMAKLQFEYLAEFDKPNLLKKTRTLQSDELNFHIPEKWNYEMEI